MLTCGFFSSARKTNQRVIHAYVCFSVHTVRLTQYNLTLVQPLPIIGMILAKVLLIKKKKPKNRTTLFSNFHITLARFFFDLLNVEVSTKQIIWPFACFTLSDSFCTLCRLCRHQNSLPVSLPGFGGYCFVLVLLVVLS